MNDCCQHYNYIFFTNIKDVCTDCGLLLFKQVQKEQCRNLKIWKESSIEEKNNLSISWLITKHKHKNFFPKKVKNKVQGIKYNNTLLDFLEYYNVNINQKYKNIAFNILSHRP